MQRYMAFFPHGHWKANSFTHTHTNTSQRTSLRFWNTGIKELTVNVNLLERKRKLHTKDEESECLDLLNTNIRKAEDQRN